MISGTGYIYPFLIRASQLSVNCEIFHNMRRLGLMVLSSNLKTILVESRFGRILLKKAHEFVSLRDFIKLPEPE